MTDKLQRRGCESKVHRSVAAWRKWLKSEEGQQCVSSGSFFGKDIKYLENRLWRAFMAGCEAEGNR